MLRQSHKLVIVKYFRDITHFENQKRLDRLSKFRTHVVTYFNNSNVTDWIADPRVENATARTARTQINLMVDEICEIVTAGDVNCRITWTPPRMVGGPTQHINLLANLFDLHRFQITPDHVITVLERSIGVYTTDRGQSILRTYNPFWWVRRLFVWVLRIPFYVIDAAGFDADRFERSIFGRATKALMGIIVTIASLLAIADYLGALEWLRSILGITSDS